MLLLQRSNMDEPTSQKERPDEQIVSPSEVWDQLSPDIQSRVSGLLAKMAYKYVLAQRGLISEKPDIRRDGGEK
jgi:hypothetical protein